MSLADPSSDSRPGGPRRRGRRRPVGAAAASGGSGSGGSAVAITPGMAMIQNAVQFTNAEVLDPTDGLSGKILPTGMQVGANALAEQAGAMMIQDVRAFLQSMEMIMVPVAALAFNESLDGDVNGATTLGLIQTTLEGLATFAGEIIAEAGETATVFS